MYDYGPAGSSLQANIINEWRKHFIVEEAMLELDTTIMTPAPVFETSGHVARFADWMVKDSKTGDVLRADHLVKNVLTQRLADDEELRSGKAQAPADAKKKAKKDKTPPKVPLAPEVAKEYETILAQVSQNSILRIEKLIKYSSLITLVAQNSANSAKNSPSRIPTPTTKSANPSSST